MTAPRHAFSIRFSEEERELVDAASEALSTARGFEHTRADVVRSALKKLLPPDGRSPELERWRKAYAEAFPKGQP